MRGSRVILMYDRSYKQRWIDSFSLLPMHLSKIPAALGFEDMTKGYFPHKFNTLGNEKYVPRTPPPLPIPLRLWQYDWQGENSIQSLVWQSAEKLSTLGVRFFAIVSMMWMCCAEHVVSTEIFFINARNFCIHHTGIQLYGSSHIQMCLYSSLTEQQGTPE